jgi:hypothetical protein
MSASIAIRHSSNVGISCFTSAKYGGVQLRNDQRQPTVACVLDELMLMDVSEFHKYYVPVAYLDL